LASCPMAMHPTETEPAPHKMNPTGKQVVGFVKFGREGGSPTTPNLIVLSKRPRCLPGTRLTFCEIFPRLRTNYVGRTAMVVVVV
jgi:hypothetical protein